MSALKLTSGYYQIPPGNYFKTTEFSILAWVKPRSYPHQSRIIEFGNGEDNNNIIFSFSDQTTGKFWFNLQESSTIYTLGLISSQSLPINKWSHVAVTFGQSITLYINSTFQISQSNQITYGITTRSLNFIGRSNWPADSYADADIDELKIFDRVLTQQELAFEMNNDIY
jgi:hypothetical protein